MRPTDPRASRISARLTSRGLGGHLRKILKEHPAFIDEVLGDSKKRSVVAARHALWLALRDEAGLSSPEVAELFETTPDTILRASTENKEARTKHALEKGVVGRIAAYVRSIGYGELAREIEAGTWRPSAVRCTVPSCPHAAQPNRGGRCSRHPEPARVA